MMNNIIRMFSLLALSIIPTVLFSQTINPIFDLETPFTLTDTTIVSADFGVAGDLITLNDSISIDITFDNNLWSEGEQFEVSWFRDPSLGLRDDTKIIWVRGADRDQLTIGAALDDIYIDENGIALFSIAVTGGDGVYITDMLYTADASIQAVPIPASIILLFSGLVMFVPLVKKS